MLARAFRSARAIDFTGRSVVIFGGSRGLGLVMARELASEGARLALVARNAEELDRAREDIAGRGARVATIVCDITDRRQVDSAIERVVSEFGTIDVLVNDAGVIQVGPLHHMTVADFENAMATHFWGPLFTILAALPHMRRAGARRIVNISSIGGKIAVPHLLPYSASKFALTGLSRASTRSWRETASASRLSARVSCEPAQLTTPGSRVNIAANSRGFTRPIPSLGFPSTLAGPHARLSMRVAMAMPS